MRPKPTFDYKCAICGKEAYGFAAGGHLGVRFPLCREHYREVKLGLLQKRLKEMAN